MGVYIKGIKMPKACYECPCQYDLIQCQALDFESICEEGFDCTTERLPNCPLVEVKTPHGRLIDENEVLKWAYELEEMAYHPIVVERSDIEDCDTMIEGED